MSATPPPFPGWDLPESPFHPGERAIQERAGVREKIEAQGRRALRRYLTPQHRDFFPMLPQLFIGSVDDRGQPWASMLVGAPGFVGVPDEHALRIATRPLFGDPLNATLRDGAPIAALGIELPTRRRNRAIGLAADVSDAGFTLDVRMTTGICPQYIQGREATFVADPLAPIPRPVHRAATLDEAARAIIAAADTYFVASNDPRAEDGASGGVDVSHRGGRPGFVRVDDPATLTAPDFVGNFMFNTFGNFLVDPRAGLLFVDFERGDMLYVAATAEVIWDAPEIAAFTGAQRLVRYRVTEVIRVERSLPVRYSAPEWSPILERTGTWEAVAKTLAAERQRDAWRPFRVTRVVEESATVRSFHLEPADGGGLATYEPGQFLPLRIALPGGAAPVLRTYTLSDAPNGTTYRISVKREGAGGVSDWLHDAAAVGTVIEAMAPRGSFTFDFAARRPAVLISAGIGITPMLAMLNSLLVNEGRTRLHSRLIFLHAARNGAEHTFAEHLRAKASKHSNLTLHVRYSQPRPEDVLGTTHHSVGRVDRALLQSLLPIDDYEFYLCGPTGFMQSIYDLLTGLGVADARIHFESFGPASVQRTVRSAPAADDSEAVRVNFTRSGKTALWRPSAGTLLDLAEREGVAPLSSCRSGVCGTCATRVTGGAVDYATAPAHEVAADAALICCATPHAGPHLDDGTPHREGVSLDL